METIKILNGTRAIDADLYYPREGCPVVVFSHGYNGCKTDFSHAAQFLEKNGIGAITFTFCGGSTRDTSGTPTKDMTVFSEAEDLKAVVKHVQKYSKEIFLFGGSMGGLVSALVADELKEKIAGLILLYPALCIADNWNDAYKTEDVIPEVLDFWGMELGKNFFKTLRGFSVAEHTGAYANPVLILHGTQDEIVPISYSREAAKRYKNAMLVPFEGERHGFSEEGNVRVEGMIALFVKQNVR